MKRRDFLKAVMTVPAVMAASEWYAAAEAQNARALEITAVVYDERYPDCSTFAEVLEKQGAMSFATSGETARVWYGALRAVLAEKGGRVAGMASDSDWVVSRTCGREQGLRVAYEGSHDCRASDRLIHRLDGSGVEREVYAALLSADVPWAESVARGLIRASRPDGVETVAIAKAGALVTPGSTGHPGYLTSWLLAPPAF